MSKYILLPVKDSILYLGYSYCFTKMEECWGNCEECYLYLEITTA